MKRYSVRSLIVGGFERFGLYENGDLIKTYRLECSAHNAAWVLAGLR